MKRYYHYFIIALIFEKNIHMTLLFYSTVLLTILQLPTFLFYTAEVSTVGRTASLGNNQAG